MVEVIDAQEYDSGLTAMPKIYRDFREKEDIPVHTGLYVRDLDALETGHWNRTGQRGALVNLDGMEGLDDIQIHEIRPGEQIEEQRHFHYKMVYVMKGRGVTRIGEGDTQQQFEWDKHSAFVVPRNTLYQHVNLSNDEPVKLVCETDLPQILDVVRDEEFVFNCEYDFWGRLSSEDAYDASSGTLGRMYPDKLGDQAPIAWEANFIPNVTKFEELDTDEWASLGAMRALRILWPLLQPIRNRALRHMHISNIPVGTYKRAHRHNPGANVFIAEGEGYTLLWNDKLYKEGIKLRVNWGPRSVFTPPGLWWHHHFNLSEEPATQFAFHAPAIGTISSKNHALDPHTAENIIRYVDEDESTRERYQAELADRGIEFAMPEECFVDPDYRFDQDWLK